MGNSSGKDYGKNYGMGFIQLEAKDVILGSYLDGVAHLNITQPLHGNQIFLYIQGKEKCHWTETRTHTHSHEGETKQRTETIHYYGKNKHCKIAYPIFTYPGGMHLPAGQYSIPFRIPVPLNIPGSVNFDWHDGKITYQLVLKAGSGNKNQIVKAVRPIHLVSQQQGQNSSFAEKQVNLKTWCCLDQGSCNAKLYTKQVSFVPGTTAEMALEIDNSRGRIDFENIKFYLKQVLTTRSTNHEQKTTTNTISLQTFKSDRILKGQIRNGAQSIFVNIPISDGNTGKMMPQTSYGKIVSVEYYLEAFGNLDGCICECCGACCGTVPDIKIPINVFGMPPNYQYYYVDPNYCMQQVQGGWAPQVLPQAQFDINFINQYQVSQQQQNQNLQYMNNNGMNQQQMQQQYPLH